METLSLKGAGSRTTGLAFKTGLYRGSIKALWGKKLSDCLDFVGICNGIFWFFIVYYWLKIGN